MNHLWDLLSALESLEKALIPSVGLLINYQVG